MPDNKARQETSSVASPVKWAPAIINQLTMSLRDILSHQHGEIVSVAPIVTHPMAYIGTGARKAQNFKIGSTGLPDQARYASVVKEVNNLAHQHSEAEPEGLRDNCQVEDTFNERKVALQVSIGGQIQI